ncbi:MAG TPA: HEAT repeat domain-containing protein [Candidatus Ozemobacteraceae bacterium]|nr:HEAT repeat domain-containing protein [Candidatus Ozemobacteraceae bacterium]
MPPAEIPSVVSGEPLLNAFPDEQRLGEHDDLRIGENSGLSEVGEKIRHLADDPDLAEIRTLVSASTAAEIGFWKEYLNRPPSLSILETVPRLLAMKHLPELVSLFTGLLEGHTPRVRANAIEALEENGDPGAIPILSSLLRDDDNRVKANAIKAMSQFGVETVLEELRGMIEDPRVEMRDSATYVLKGIRGQEPAILLERLLRDGSALVRFNAIRSLAVQGDPRNTQRLMEYLPEVADPEERDLLFKSISELQKSS